MEILEIVIGFLIGYPIAELLVIPLLEKWFSLRRKENEKSNSGM